MVRLLMECPNCHEEELLDKTNEAYCRICKMSIILWSKTYDQFRDFIADIITEHSLNCNKKIFTAVDEYMNVSCTCGFIKYVAYVK